jgi:hypothetical protein
MLSPTAVHQDGRSLPLNARPIAESLHRTGRGVRMWKLNIGLPMGLPKVDGGYVTGTCWAPRAVHQDRWLIRTSLAQPWAYMDAIKAASKPESSLFWCDGIGLFAGAQEYAYLDCTNRSKVSSKPHAGVSFCSSTATLCASLWILNYNV